VTAGRIAVFLDRDGTLNEEVEFVRTPEELRLIPGAAGAVRTLNALGVITCIISNQSGVARGIITEADLVPVHAKLKDELRKEGARLDAIYYCPHHPTEGIPPFRIDCECRKPGPGMLLRARGEFTLDLGRSFVVGDRLADIQAGKAVGATTVLVLTGYGTVTAGECRQEQVVPDCIAPSIVEAVRFVQEQISKEQASHE